MGNMSIFIGNLSLGITEAELRGIFVPFGQVSSVTVMNDNYIGSGQLRSYGYIEMPSKNEGEAAILRLNGTPYRGRDITVIEAMPKNRPEEAISGKPRSARARQRSDNGECTSTIVK
jgi:RNA recognition motif-containing protein